MASFAASLLAIFRRIDFNQDGTVSKASVSDVLQKLDPEVFSDANIAPVLDQCMVSYDSISYMDLIKWLVQDALRPEEASPVCQAALEGSMEKLERIAIREGPQALQKSGYVQVNGVVMGLKWVGRGVELWPLSEDPALEVATAAQYAAFKGNAATLCYLLKTCSVFGAETEAPPCLTNNVMPPVPGVNCGMVSADAQENGEEPTSPTSSGVGWVEETKNVNFVEYLEKCELEQLEPEHFIFPVRDDRLPAPRLVPDDKHFSTDPSPFHKSIIDQKGNDVVFLSDGQSSYEEEDSFGQEEPQRRSTSTQKVSIPSPEELGIRVWRRLARANSL